MEVSRAVHFIFWNSGCAVCSVSITAQDRAIFCLSDHWEHGTYYWRERICKYPPMCVFQSYIIDHNIVWKSCLFFCHQEVQLVSVGSWSSLILWCPSFGQNLNNMLLLNTKVHRAKVKTHVIELMLAEAHVEKVPAASCDLETLLRAMSESSQIDSWICEE